MDVTGYVKRVFLMICTAFLFNACAEDASSPKGGGGASGAKTDSIVLGMGCFWGAEKRMASLPGVVDVESGYANGDVPGNYDAVLAHEATLQRGRGTKRNHAEVVKVTFDPAKVGLETVLIRFWESHDPTQGDRQGNDVGSNYRSAIYTTGDAQRAVALKTRDAYQSALAKAGFGPVTTEIDPLRAYFRAEDTHQDYLEKNPRGYCGIGGTGVRHPFGTLTAEQKRIAFEAGTERPFTSPHLDEKRPGTFVDPINGNVLKFVPDAENR